MKKKLILTLIFAIAIIALGCEKDNINMTNVDIGSLISYLDSTGQDLLDPNTSNAYNIDDIKVFHYINNEKILFSRGNLDNSKGFFVSKDLGMEYYMLALAQVNDYNETGSNYEYETITFLELRSNETDTIKCLIRLGENSYICRRVHYNSNLVWAWEDIVPREFIIQK